MKLSRERHLESGGDPAADPRRGVERVESFIVFLHSGKIFGHGAVDASVDRSHHVAYDVWFLHFSFVLSVGIISGGS